MTLQPQHTYPASALRFQVLSETEAASSCILQVTQGLQRIITLDALLLLLLRNILKPSTSC